MSSSDQSGTSSALGGSEQAGDGYEPLLSNTKHHAEGEEGEGNWLISYADLMTLLVGFFVILLSFATVDQEKMDEVRKAMTEEFGGTYESPFGDIKDRVVGKLDKLGMGDQFVVKHTDFGIEISFLGTAFFTTGEADVKPEGASLLERLIPVISAESKDFNFVIEGHTDDVPVGTHPLFRNNFELSSLRACRVLDAFLGAGFSKDRMIAVGYGDSKPAVPNRDEQGNAIPANQSQNRRVVIKMMKRAENSIMGDPSSGLEHPRDAKPSTADSSKPAD